MRLPTFEESERFAVIMANHYDATLTDKDNLESEAIAFLLALLKVTDKVTFLSSTATTLGTVMYIPFEMSPTERISTIVHELIHVLQYAPRPDVWYGPALDVATRAALEGGKLVPGMADILNRLSIDESRIRVSGFGFAWLYLIYSQERVVFETHAYCAAMEFVHRAWGWALPTSDEMVERLSHGYDLEPSDLELARTIFRSRRQEVAMGVKRSSVATKAIEVLRSIDPELVLAEAA